MFGVILLFLIFFSVCSVFCYLIILEDKFTKKSNQTESVLEEITKHIQIIETGNRLLLSRLNQIEKRLDQQEKRISEIEKTIQES